MLKQTEMTSCQKSDINTKSSFEMKNLYAKELVCNKHTEMFFCPLNASYTSGSDIWPIVFSIRRSRLPSQITAFFSMSDTRDLLHCSLTTFLMRLEINQTRLCQNSSADRRSTIRLSANGSDRRFQCIFLHLQFFKRTVERSEAKFLLTQKQINICER